MEKSKGFKALIYIVIITLAFIAAVMFGVYQRAKAVSYGEDIKMNYQRVFTELVQYADDLSVSLEKSRFAGDPKQMIRISGEIYRQAAQAKASLALLPLSTTPLDNVSNFLSQAGDYAYSLSLRMIDGQEAGEEEYANLKSLSDYAKAVAAALDTDMEKMNAGTFSIENAAEGVGESPLASYMGEIEEQLHDYPALIYDGPFSSHLADREPLLTSGMAEIDESAAVEKIKALTGLSELEVSEEDGSVPLYYITGEKDSGTVTAAVTKAGGVLEYYLYDREVGDSAIELAAAKLIAAEFLQNNGFSAMKESYYENIGGEAVINFAAEQDGYILYPDLVKVKVALDTGEVTGLEARGYIMYHTERNIPEAKITISEAREKVNKNVEILNVSRAVIPLDDGTERFTWQITGELDGRKCLIYVNTQTGGEEKLFLLEESDSGTLCV